MAQSRGRLGLVASRASSGDDGAEHLEDIELEGLLVVVASSGGGLRKAKLE